MKKTLVFATLGVVFNLSGFADEDFAARGVLERTLGKEAAHKIELKRESGAGDSYRYHAAGGKLTVTGTSTPALCRGLQENLRANNLGTVGWAGPRLRLPAEWPDAAEKQVTSPFRIRHCYNAVTPGYTTPYWGWERWERDWIGWPCTALT